MQNVDDDDKVGTWMRMNGWGGHAARYGPASSLDLAQQHAKVGTQTSSEQQAVLGKGATSKNWLEPDELGCRASSLRHLEYLLGNEGMNTKVAVNDLRDAKVASDCDCGDRLVLSHVEALHHPVAGLVVCTQR